MRVKSSATSRAPRDGARVPQPAVSPDALLQQFRVVLTAIKTHFQHVERLAGIGGAQVWALAVIRDQPDIGVGELAAILNVRQPTASNLVRNLVDGGYISHARRVDDRRGVALRISRRGRTLLRRVSPPYQGVLPVALAKLDDETRRRLSADLELLISHLNEDDTARLRPLATL